MPTLAQLNAKLSKMLDDDLTHYPRNTILVPTLNKAQRMVALLTYCLESTSNIPITNGVPYIDLSATLSDFIAPLRVSFNGVRLLPYTLHELDLADDGWRTRVGNPTKYAQHGFYGVWITPTPAAGTNVLTLTRAREPAPLVNDADVPDLPDDQNIDLTDGAFYFARLFEGGTELQNATKYFQRFLAQVQKYQKFTRSRSQGQLYDRQPFDLSSTDMSRFDIKLHHTQPGKLKPIKV